MADDQLPDAGADDRREALLDGWDRAAPGWARQADRWREVTQPVTDWLVEAATPRAGERVLELACGAGDVGLAAAWLVAPGGSVLCSDAAEPMLALARARAAELALENVEFKQLQLESIDLPTATADVLFCRWGLMFALDPLAALKEFRRVLKPGGRLALAVWDSPAVNPWKTLPREVLVDVGQLDPDAPQPEMFGLSDSAMLAELLADAGLFEVAFELIEIEREFTSLLDLIGVSCDMSADFAAVWKGLDDGGRRGVRARLAELAVPFRSGKGEGLKVPGRAIGVRAEA